MKPTELKCIDVDLSTESCVWGVTIIAKERAHDSHAIIEMTPQQAERLAKALLKHATAARKAAHR